MSTKTLLCVERESKASDERRAALEHAGYVVILTDSAAEALKIFVSHTVDAVLLDADLANGKKHSLRGQMSSIRPQVPMIALCGDQQPVAARFFTHVFRKRDGTRGLLRILQKVLGDTPPKHHGRSADG